MAGAPDQSVIHALGRSHEGSDFLVVLPARSNLDTAGNIDSERFHLPDGLSNILGRQATSQEDRLSKLIGGHGKPPVKALSAAS